MPKIDIAKIPVDAGSNYPQPFRRIVAGRERKRLGNAAGLDQFGVNLTTLKPGAASSMRHWHQKEDELVFILEGEVVLIDDSGETVLKPGDRRLQGQRSERASPRQQIGPRRAAAGNRLSLEARARRIS